MPSLIIVTDQQFSQAPDVIAALRPLIEKTLAARGGAASPAASYQLVNFPDQLRIAEVRALQTQLATTGGERVFILTDLQRASGVVQNSLLKSLEEPPSEVTLVLVTDSLDPILPTVQSRCLLIRAPSAPASIEPLFPSLEQLQYDRWRELNVSQLAALLTDAFAKNQAALKKTHPELTQTAITTMALTAYLRQITAELSNGDDLAWQRRVLATLTQSLRLMRANVSPKNVFYFAAIELASS